jgi:hypothetical protein
MKAITGKVLKVNRNDYIVNDPKKVLVSFFSVRLLGLPAWAGVLKL